MNEFFNDIPFRFFPSVLTPLPRVVDRERTYGQSSRSIFSVFAARSRDDTLRKVDRLNRFAMPFFVCCGRLLVKDQVFGTILSRNGS